MLNQLRKSRLSVRDNKIICNAHSVKSLKSQYDKSWNGLKPVLEELRVKKNVNQLVGDVNDGLGLRGFLFVPKTRKFFDQKKFAEDNPVLYEKYMKEMTYYENKPIA